MSRRTLACCFALLLAAVPVAQRAEAVTVKRYVITNNSGAARSDLHLEFTGTGGTATLKLLKNAPGCPAPTITNPGTPFDINWGAACVAVGASITVEVAGDFSSGYWTPGGPGDFPLAGGDVTPVPLPGLPPWGIGALALLLLAAGVIVLRRRAPVFA